MTTALADFLLLNQMIEFFIQKIYTKLHFSGIFDACV